MTIKKNAKKNAVVVAVVTVPCNDVAVLELANTINSMTPAMRNVLLDGFDVAAATKQLVIDTAFDACLEYIASIEDATSINTMLDSLEAGHGCSNRVGRIGRQYIRQQFG